MDPRVEKLLKLPTYQKVLALVALVVLIVGLFIYFLYLPKQAELANLQKQYNDLQLKLQQDQRIADNLPIFKAEYEKMKEQLSAALSELPNEKEIPTLLTSIASSAKDNGLDVTRFRPGAEIPKDFYAEVPVELNLIGTYHQAALFFQAVSEMSRIVNINNLTLGGAKTDEGTTLSVTCLATTFRFLEGKTAPAGASTASKGKK